MEVAERRRALTELVSTKTVVSYDELMAHLKFEDEQVFETFIINSIYDGVVDVSVLIFSIIIQLRHI